MCHGEKLRALSDARDGAERFVEMDRRTASRGRAPRGSARKGLKRLEGRAALGLVINRLSFVAAAKVAEMEGMRGGAIAREHDEGGGYDVRARADRRDEVASFVQMDRVAGRALGLVALPFVMVLSWR